jgi:hypothetical protein
VPVEEPSTASIAVCVDQTNPGIPKSPGEDKQSNWLPAPNGTFSLCIRVYWVDEAILNGQWKPPLVSRVQ